MVGRERGGREGSVWMVLRGEGRTEEKGRWFTSRYHLDSQ